MRAGGSKAAADAAAALADGGASSPILPIPDQLRTPKIPQVRRNSASSIFVHVFSVQIDTE
jgi:hypothetical protein